jgi:hypothetical protein
LPDCQGVAGLADKSGVWFAPGAGCQIAKVCALGFGKVPITGAKQSAFRSRLSAGVARAAGSAVPSAEGKIQMLDADACTVGPSCAWGRGCARDSIKLSAVRCQLPARLLGLRVCARQWRGVAEKAVHLQPEFSGLCVVARRWRGVGKRQELSAKATASAQKLAASCCVENPNIC